jgi:ring-1,2-phenylacetyl-CoA epoxidase subunit PaaC
MNALLKFCLRMGDNTLILSHRNSEWCGHAPILEEDIALANMALDLIGQTQLWYGLAGEIEGKGRTPDNIAFLRETHEFENALLVEQPNRDFGHSLMRQYLFDAWHFQMLAALKTSTDARVAAIAEKALKEVSYHIERSRDLVIRLGDGTEESHGKMQDALDRLWSYCADFFESDAVDAQMVADGIAPETAVIEANWRRELEQTFAVAHLTIPESIPHHKGGKAGVHTEHMGYILAEMQVLQRTYPGATW